MNRTHVTWTTKEIQMLEKLYPLYASKIPQLGRHTFYAINARAKHMGVKYIPKKDRDVNTKLRQWDPWEVEALRREYPYYGSRAAGSCVTPKVPFTQSIAYSVDRGRTFEKYADNPVLGHVAGGNRDPKVFWHAPTKQWIMALYVGRSGKLHTVQLLTSSNLREWTELSAVRGDEGGGRYLYECPDLFELSCGTGRNARRACRPDISGGSGRRLPLANGLRPQDRRRQHAGLGNQ